MKFLNAIRPSLVVGKVLGLALVLSAMASVARADTPLPAPEIDPGTASSALTLIAGGMLILKDRLRAK